MSRDRWALLLASVLVLPAAVMADDDTVSRANAAYENQDFAEAAKLLRPLAENGDANAQLRLGILYQFGRGVEQSYPEAMAWYQQADRHGNDKAKSRIEALQKLIDAKRDRDAEVANAPKPEADIGTGVANILGAVAQGYATAKQSAAGASSAGASGGSIHYSGPYSREVAYLLTHSPSHWAPPSCETCNDGAPPAVPPNLPCQRDAYYYAALASAWAAESHARFGKWAAAAENARGVRTNLDNVNRLCSSAPVIAPGRQCPTQPYWDCPGW